jgi:hypothetical protein
VSPASRRSCAKAASAYGTMRARSRRPWQTLLLGEVASPHGARPGAASMATSCQRSTRRRRQRPGRKSLEGRLRLVAFQPLPVMQLCGPLASGELHMMQEKWQIGLLRLSGRQHHE